MKANSKLFAIISFLLIFFSVGCVRPAPRPENVQITEVPLAVTLVATPTTPVEVTAVSPTEATGEDAEATTAPASSGPQTHEVVAGDTLSRIAVIYGVSIEEIIAANDLANPDALELGQLLTIPEPGAIDLTAVAETAVAPQPTTAAAATPEADATAEPVEEGEQIYIVQAGDTLFSIALAYGLTLDELAEYNEIENVDELDIGQEIRIP